MNSTESNNKMMQFGIILKQEVYALETFALKVVNLNDDLNKELDHLLMT